MRAIQDGRTLPALAQEPPRERLIPMCGKEGRPVRMLPCLLPQGEKLIEPLAKIASNYLFSLVPQTDLNRRPSDYKVCRRSRSCMRLTHSARADWRYLHP